MDFFAVASLWQGDGGLSSQVLSWLGDLWPYLTLAATALVLEEVAPVIAGFAVQQQHLTLGGAFLAALIGVQGGQVILYFVGRRHGPSLRRKWPKSRHLARALLLVRRHPWRIPIVMRYAIGVRVILPIACGAARIPIRKFLIGNTIGAILWLAPFMFLGWLFGETAVTMVGHLRRHFQWVALGLGATVAIIAIVIHVRGKRVEEKVQKVVIGKDAAVLAEEKRLAEEERRKASLENPGSSRPGA